jgi:hypothetical protein
LEFIYGFLGALLCLALFIGGSLAGWKARAREEQQKRPAPVQANEVTRQKLIAQQEAFHRVQNYSVEDAYGLNSVDAKEE